jgi:hypothetical protein
MATEHVCLHRKKFFMRKDNNGGGGKIPEISMSGKLTQDF